MKTKALSLLALGAVVLASVVSAADDRPKITLPSTQPAQKQVKLFKIATINGAQALREFEHNVQVLQAERQAAVDLQNAMNKETDAKKKKDLKAKFDAAAAKLDADNATMSKAYGFSITRNYQMEYESANIYVEVTDEEAAKLEAEQNAAAQKAKK